MKPDINAAASISIWLFEGNRSAGTGRGAIAGAASNAARNVVRSVGVPFRYGANAANSESSRSGPLEADCADCFPAGARSPTATLSPVPFRAFDAQADLGPVEPAAHAHHA